MFKDNPSYFISTSFIKHNKNSSYIYIFIYRSRNRIYIYKLYKIYSLVFIRIFYLHSIYIMMDHTQMSLYVHNLCFISFLQSIH